MASLELGKKRMPRVDMTPMVDLGFLLITFFVMTTTLNQAKSLDLTVPDETPTTNPSVLKHSQVINVLVGAKKFATYIGLDTQNVNQHNSILSLRNEILSNKARIRQMQNEGTLSPNDELNLFIRPTENSTLQDLINVLDEVRINDIKSYALSEATVKEANLLKPR